MTIVDWLWLFAMSFGAAALALTVAAVLDGRARRLRAGLFAESTPGTVFLFDGETLLDASAGARALLAASRGKGSAWQRFLAYAGPRFPGVAEHLDRLPDLGRLSIASPGSEGLTMVAEWRSGVRRITLLEPHIETSGRLIDSLAQKAQDQELEVLRQITDTAPHPVWREGTDTVLTWANPAYVALAFRAGGEGALIGWPLPRLLDPGRGGRVALDLPGQAEPLWFDCHSVPQPDGRIVFAIPADTTVHAEQALTSFVQTLTKTFAHLPIGLAIFDRQRKLQLFNPALTDLTDLPFDFLSGRPTLYAFLDAMRERGMIPEPKDYKAWRAQIAALERSAASGQHEETWTLATGQTYRITGRPHPEGALALLFQDISDEIGRARRMRADLEIGQSVIDATDEAIAVFSSAGHLLMANLAYVRLWSQDPTGSLVDHPISDLAATWRAACAPSPFWSRAEAYVATSGHREPWTAVARMNDGRALRCRLAPLAGGATLVGFSNQNGQDAGHGDDETRSRWRATASG